MCSGYRPEIPGLEAGVIVAVIADPCRPRLSSGRCLGGDLLAAIC
jgi:hypothetical protein